MYVVVYVNQYFLEFWYIIEQIGGRKRENSCLHIKSNRKYIHNNEREVALQ